MPCREGLLRRAASGPSAGIGRSQASRAEAEVDGADKRLARSMEHPTGPKLEADGSCLAGDYRLHPEAVKERWAPASPSGSSRHDLVPRPKEPHLCPAPLRQGVLVKVMRTTLPLAATPLLDPRQLKLGIHLRGSPGAATLSAGASSKNACLAKRFRSVHSAIVNELGCFNDINPGVHYQQLC